ncbi:signal peptide peptidase-domain-containing protein [Kalaharituber pfeilii]|nr:signal peptide peptidase-domain-containing protein [Kalaharituber pfeilii]
MAEPNADPPSSPTSSAGLMKALVPFIPTYTHLLLTALLPIVTGAHASLTRPNNVRPPQPKSGSRAKPATAAQQGEEEEEEEDESMPVETLTPKDAILFPVTAGVMLGGLYLIIKYLDDPTILSKILTYYFTLVGTYAVGKFFADTLGVIVSITFPRRWSELVGGKRRVYVAGHDRYKLHITGQDTETAGIEKEKFNPFPKSLVPVPKSLYAPLWGLRRQLLAKWAVLFKLGRGKGEVTRTTFWIGDLVGLIVGVLCVAAYVMSSKHWIGTNIMGVSFAYGAMQLISPTTFSTATLLLSLLFFYDIYFVFYTPLMVTVATNLDVPIKLLFPRPSQEGADPKKSALAMLGLGDVVLPGIMIAMALRFDYWRWCEAQRIWNCGMADLPGVFPKTYFYASLGGYVAGMLTTLVVMHVFNHAQPALLYLVPGVLGSVWGTALVRGEVGMAWRYTEEVDAEEEKGKKKEGAKEKEIKQKPVEKPAEKQVEVIQPAMESAKEGTPEPESAKEEHVEETKTTEDATENVNADVKEDKEAEKTKAGADAERDNEDDIELVDEKGEAEYISVKIVKKPAPGAAVRR